MHIVGENLVILAQICDELSLSYHTDKPNFLEF